MLRKEIKKIVCSKTVIVLLLSLCIINLILGTREVKLSEEESLQIEAYQKERIENYDSFLEKVKQDGEAMQGFSLFSDNNKFQVENAKRTVKAYEEMNGVNPVYGNYQVIEELTDFGFSDVILFVMAIQLALLLINQELAKGMLDLLKSCRNGRMHLIISKIVANSIVLGAVVAIVYGTRFLQLYIMYGIDNLNVPIQSVAGFYESTLSMSILQYLIIFFTLKWLATCIIGFITVSIISLTKNETVTYGILILLTTISVVVYKGIEWDTAVAIFKMLSLVTMLDTKGFTCSYLNINFLQIPFQLTKTIFAIMLVYLMLSVFFAMYSFVRKGKNKIDIRKYIGKRISNIRKIKTHSIFTYEQKKILLINKVLVLIIIFGVLQGYILEGKPDGISYYDRCYKAYISKVYGVHDENSQKYLDEEQARYDKLQLDFNDVMTGFIAGEVDAQVFAMAQQEYNSQMRPYDAFCEVQNKSEYLKRLKEEQNIDGWFTYDTGIKYMFDELWMYDKNISFLLLFIVIILGVVPVFSYDNQTEMTKLLNTTYFGRSKLVRNKYLSAVSIAVVLWAIEALTWLIVILKLYPPNGLLAPLQSIQLFEKFPVNIPIIAGIILFYLCKCIGSVVLAMFVVGMSELLRDYVRTVIIMMSIVVIPMVLLVMGVSVMSKVMFLPIINMSTYFTDASIVEWINIMVIIVFTVALNNRKIRGIMYGFRSK